jgi:hypothetical protein
MLVLYNRLLIRRPYEASTVEEHFHAFARHSRFTVWEWNVQHGYPRALDDVDPSVVVLHYSIFGSGLYVLDDRTRDFLLRTHARKVAFFQDEMAWMKKRFQFVDDYDIDTVYTHIAEEHFDATWRRYTSVPELIHNFPGYVSDAMLDGARRYALPDDRRDIDVGYRGRPLPSWLGRAAREKSLIGEEFARRAAHSGLRLDISTREEDRIYGPAWHQFIGRCRAMLGVESGVSYLDLEDEVLAEYNRILAARGEPPSLNELEAGVLSRWDGNFPYRTISPRHLEAAAFGVCQVLFTGDYAGVMRPMEHYLPLEKDLSNIEEVISQLRRATLRRQIAQNAHRDLIVSGQLSYRAFVDAFDRRLMSHGLDPQCTAADRLAWQRALRSRQVEQWRTKRRAELDARRELIMPRLRHWRQLPRWYVYCTVAPVSRRVRRALGLAQKNGH